MYRLSFYVPINEAEKVKEALFEVGAGRIGLYECCCWETLGTGQFRPMQGSNPAIGKKGKLEKVKELKVEMVCDDDRIQNSVDALKLVHPYEEPAYEVYRIESF